MTAASTPDDCVRLSVREGMYGPGCRKEGKAQDKDAGRNICKGWRERWNEGTRHEGLEKRERLRKSGREEDRKAQNEGEGNDRMHG